MKSALQDRLLRKRSRSEVENAPRAVVIRLIPLPIPQGVFDAWVEPWGVCGTV